jgi:Holliday junction resolvase RusA-like endonuclease
MIHEFTVPGSPASWQVYRKGGQQRNRLTREWETIPGYLALHQWQATIQKYALEYWWQDGAKEPLKGLIYLKMMFWLPWPLKARKSSQRAKERWLDTHRKMKPDTSNYNKAFEDALQGIIYVNDSQVVHIEGSKDFVEADEGYTVCWVEAL